MMKRNFLHSGMFLAAAVCLAFSFFLAGCSPAAEALPTATVQPAATLPPPPTATEQPSPTPTLEPTATLEPTVTPTLPPTATQVPPLGLLPDGFSAWCAPREYAGVKPAGPDAPEYANKLVISGSSMQVKIPAAYCVLSARFNQPFPTGASLVLYDGKSPFLKLPMTAADGQVDLGWAAVSHDFVVNPPYWDVTYRVAVVGPNDQELWSNPVKFAKPLPNPCPYGGYPDPVTLFCGISDPLEIEPHPDITWPVYYTREP